ncbi:tagaturonate reductase [Sorangium sp. So ce1182]|uniref:tagaturonate reductase n=1 Tax=Sorangium sp. So ce1182 TaxID=3133334 RepID=UPI003F6287F3
MTATITLRPTRRTRKAVTNDTTGQRPVRIVQFGDGVFLRAFIGWMVDRMNERADFDGAIAVVKPRPGDFHPAYARQQNRYNVVFKGLSAGCPEVARSRVESIARLVNPYEDFSAFLREADNPDLACVVSNTTESGIVRSADDRATDRPAASFPGMLTQLLRRRYETFGGDRNSGIIVMPCELIESNGATLRSIVLEHADRWYGDARFLRWIEGANRFVDTLVDRIVSGFSEEERAIAAAETGVDDELLVVAEPYHLLAIKGPAELDRILPLRRAGLNAVWADDISSYRLLKVRLLNGSHTFMTMCGLSMGLENVLGCMNHATLRQGLHALHALETLPCTPLPRADSEAYLASTLERFANPFLDHRLASISLGSVAKWRARLMPPLLDCAALRGEAPVLLSFSLAALTYRYVSCPDLRDEPSAVARFTALSGLLDSDPRRVAREVVASAGLWGDDLARVPGLQELVGAQLADITSLGMGAALRKATSSARELRRRDGLRA